MKEPLDLILLIDDDEDDNIYHTYVINKAGVAKQVDHVYDGREAIEYLCREGRYSDRKGQAQPNLIFVDINMPGMDGWEFLEAYQKLPLAHQAEVVIVMLTTSVNPDDKAKALQFEKVTDFLNKPLKEETLKKIIAQNFPDRL